MMDLCEALETNQAGWVKVNGRIVAATKLVNGSIEYRWMGRNRTADKLTAATFAYDGEPDGYDCD